MLSQISVLPIIFLLGAGFVILIEAELPSSISRSGFEEPCNTTLKCKSQSFLSCHSQSKTCLCLKPETMTYDKSLDKCVVLIGERCLFSLQDETQSSWFKTAPCASSAVCTNGVCSCPPGSYEDLNLSLCHPCKDLNGNCSRELECNEKKMLRCINETCLCDPIKSVINPSDKTFEAAGYFSSYRESRSTTPRPMIPHVPEGACLSKVGQHCSFETQQFCVKNSVCRDNICECLPPYKLTSSGLCGLGYGQKCNSSSYNQECDDDICSDKFVCANTNRLIGRETTCSCPNPQFQEYDKTCKACRSRVGALCDMSEPYSCSEGSSCVKTEGNNYRCQCHEGLIVSDRYECEIAYGQPCNYDRYYAIGGNTCDSISGLLCRNGNCSCPNELDVYEGKRRLCATRAGQSCKSYKECVSNSNCTIKLQPITRKIIPGTCECLGGFKDDGAGICKSYFQEMTFPFSYGSK